MLSRIFLAIFSRFVSQNISPAAKGKRKFLQHLFTSPFLRDSFVFKRNISSTLLALFSRTRSNVKRKEEKLTCQRNALLFRRNVAQICFNYEDNASSSRWKWPAFRILKHSIFRLKYEKDPQPNGGGWEAKKSLLAKLEIRTKKMRGRKTKNVSTFFTHQAFYVFLTTLETIALKMSKKNMFLVFSPFSILFLFGHPAKHLIFKEAIKNQLFASAEFL